MRATIANPDGPDRWPVRDASSASQAKAPVVPQAALQVDQSGSTPAGRRQRRKVEQRRVQTGSSADRRRRLLGLQEGEKVIVDGVRRYGGVRSCRRRSGPRRWPTMISGIFIDRPRLAIVIAIVTTIAGLLAIMRDPGRAAPGHRAAAGLASRPPIPAPLPRWWRRRWRSPSSSRSSASTTMIYIKSHSGNDGSYTLTVTFALGTDPTSTRSTSEPRSACHPAAAAGGAAPGRDGIRKKSSRSCRSSLYTPEQLRRALSQQLRDHQRHRSAGAHPRRRPGDPVRPLDYSLRIWLDTDRLTAFNLTPTDVIAAIQARTSRPRSVASAPRRRPATSNAAHHQDPGPADPARPVRQHRDPRQSRRLGGARQGRRPRRSRRQDRGHLSRFNGAPSAAIGIYPVARRQRR